MRKFIDMVDDHGNTVHVRASEVIAVRLNPPRNCLGAARPTWQVAVDTVCATYLQDYTTGGAARAAQEEIMVELEDRA